MTAIVIAKKSKNKCVIASERRCSGDDGTFYIDPRPKVRKAHGLLVGGSGSAAPLEIFMMLDKLTEVQETTDPFHFIVTQVAPAWKKALIEACLIDTTQETNDENLESSAILCHKGRAFSLDLSRNGSIHTTEMSLPASSGCGGTLGLAALKALQTSHGPELLLQDMAIALTIVSTLNNACDDNIDIISE